MTTGKDYGLPTEYADWVLGAHHPLYTDGGHGVLVATVFFVPPKPTLPDVRPGAVLRYVDRSGDMVRVMRNNAPGWRWDAWHDTHDSHYSDGSLLADVNDDGFTVELGGL